MKRYLILYFIISFLSVNCKQSISEDELLTIGITDCRKQPAFIKSTGLQPQRAALSTSEKRIKGLVLIEVPQTVNDTARRTWRHPSWDSFGWMGPLTTDEAGNTYLAPVPTINVLDNPSDQQNIIYKVKSNTGEMKPFINLADKTSPVTGNPYGLLGLYYECHDKRLYASTVAGSTMDEEKGRIIGIDVSSKKATAELVNIDAIGLCVGGMTGEKRLYFGTAREPAIYSVLLSASGEFNGQPRLEISLDMLGPRGDDKARRIRFDKNGDMLINGIEFNFNLTAPTEKQEGLYRFRYYDDIKKWGHVR